MATGLMNGRKALQREFKACITDHRIKHIVIDIYCDRAIFCNKDNWLVDFFERRGMMTYFDRGGLSIDLKDAAKFDIPIAPGGYYLHKDLRKPISKI